ncbi:MAG: glutaminyl-peptide cyclotransferase [Chloroflexota bacterium]
MHRQRPLSIALLLFVMVAPAVAAAEAPSVLTWDVLSRRPHSKEAFTQGLLLDEQGRLFESTGLYGSSSLRELDAQTGDVLRGVRLPDDRFGEGLALVADRLIQLTWRSGEAFVWQVETFELLDILAYEGEGWGLCYDGERLVMSDGSDTLTFRDPGSFEATGAVAVTLDGQPLNNLNELECVDDKVWANVWLSDSIVRIDPADGRIDAMLDVAGILMPHPADAHRGNVLNGIAYDAEADTYLVTGKRWPELIEIRIDEGES